MLQCTLFIGLCLKALSQSGFDSMGTGLGIFWIDWMCKPFLKGLMKQPELIVLLICLIYGYVAYKLVKTAYLSDL